MECKKRYEQPLTKPLNLYNNILEVHRPRHMSMPNWVVLKMETEHNGYRWKILAMSYLCMLVFALVFQSIPPILTLIMDDLKITQAWQGGLLMSLFALPGIFIAIPSGIISDRFGIRKVGIASLILMVVGTFVVGISNSLLLIGGGRLISGIGALTLATVLPQLLSRWFMNKELGISMGVFNTAVPLGTITSFNFLGILGSDLGWQLPIFLTTIVSAIALLIFLWLFKEPTMETKRKGTSLSSNIVSIGVPIWIISFTWMWFNAAFISFLTFTPSFFVSKGYETGFAGFMSSIVMMGSLFLSPLIGYLVYKFGKEEMFIVVGGVALTLLIFLIPTTSFHLPLLALIGIFASFVPAPIYSLPSKTVQPKSLGLGFGILTACLNVGVLTGPYLTGLARDFTGEYTTSFYLMSFFAIMQTVTIMILHFFKYRKMNN